MTKDIRFVITVKDREPFYFNQNEWAVVRRFADNLHFVFPDGEVAVFDQLQDEFVPENEWLSK